MRILITLGITVLMTTGCASLAWHDDDSVEAKTGKTLARIPLGLATLGMSELAIERAEKEEVVRREKIACQERGMVLVYYRDTLHIVGCMTQQGFEAMKAAEAANRPSINPFAAMLLLQAMQAPPSHSYQPLPAPSFTPIPAPRRPLNCMSNAVGNSVYTNCY